MNTPELELTVAMKSLLRRIRALAEVAYDLDALEKAVVAAIAAELPAYHWTGFY
jgi:hypothetical protein